MAAPLDSAAQQETDKVEQLLAGYKPLPGTFDEMMDRDGRVRPHWHPLLAMFAGLGPKEVSRRFAAADRHLRDSGVFYRVYEDPAGATPTSGRRNSGLPATTAAGSLPSRMSRAGP